MEAVLGARLAEVLDVPGDGDGVGVGLLEHHHPGAGLLRLGSIARLAVGSDNTSRFQRKGGHGLVCNCNSLVESLYHILYCMQDMVRNNDKLLKIPTLHRTSDICHLTSIEFSALLCAFDIFATRNCAYAEFKNLKMYVKPWHLWLKAIQ